MSLDPPATHRRSVRLDRVKRSLEIEDEISGGRHDLRLAFHCGPEVEAELDGALAVLRWPRGAAAGHGRLELPPQLRWSLHRGETDPILGWFAPGLGRRVPAFTLVGQGHPGPGELLRTTLTFSGEAAAPIPDTSAHAVPWGPPASTGEHANGTRAEAT
jgi:hypothetical protein